MNLIERLLIFHPINKYGEHEECSRRYNLYVHIAFITTFLSK
ncbi:MAG: hypothetical protein ABSE83_02340 [Methanobacterium sp.]